MPAPFAKSKLYSRQDSTKDVLTDDGNMKIRDGVGGHDGPREICRLMKQDS
jgi:hypothetical protein